MKEAVEQRANPSDRTYAHGVMLLRCSQEAYDKIKAFQVPGLKVIAGNTDQGAGDYLRRKGFMPASGSKIILARHMHGETIKAEPL